MGIKKVETWKCDLCTYSTANIPEGSTPDGWIKVQITDSMLDRMFHEKCICTSCMKDIIFAIVAKPKIFHVQKIS